MSAKPQLPSWQCRGSAGARVACAVARSDRRRHCAAVGAWSTFVVLAGLTPIAPTHEVVVTLLAGQRASRCCFSLGSSAREVWRRCAGTAPRPRRGAPACAHRRPVLRDRRGAGRSGGRRGEHDARSRPRSPVFAADLVADRELRPLSPMPMCASIDQTGPRRQHRDWQSSSRAQSRCSIRTASSSSSSSSVQASIRGLPAVVMLDKDLKVDRSGRRAHGTQYAGQAPRQLRLPSIDDTEPQIEMVPDGNYVAAVIKLHDLRRIPTSTSRACSIRGWSRNCARRERRRSIRRSRGAPARHADRLRLDVHRDRADRAACRRSGSG